MQGIDKAQCLPIIGTTALGSISLLTGDLMGLLFAFITDQVCFRVKVEQCDYHPAANLAWPFLLERLSDRSYTMSQLPLMVVTAPAAAAQNTSAAAALLILSPICSPIHNLQNLHAYSTGSSRCFEEAGPAQSPDLPCKLEQDLLRYQCISPVVHIG